jgi:hypothetical protein
MSTPYRAATLVATNREFQELDERILLTELKSDAAHAVTKRCSRIVGAAR